MERLKVYEACLKQVNEHLEELNNNLLEIRQALGGEAKSSAGDKYETSRAMLHMEQEKLGQQLEEVMHQHAHLLQLEHHSPGNAIDNGSLIKTDKGFIFLSIPLGKIKVDGTDIMIISPASPLGMQLQKKKVGEEVSLNGNTFKIELIIKN